MPFPGQHACRLVQPDSCRDGDENWGQMMREHEGKPYRVIRGRLKSSGDWVDQAFRYDPDKWTPEQAQAHCTAHKGLEFTRATGDQKKKSAPVEMPMMLRAYTPLTFQASKVGRENRIISGYSVITAGEAAGHGIWIDAEALDQVVAQGNAAPKGIKSRFTHPGLCSDGLGKYMGRSREFRREANRVLADLHFADATKLSPAFNKDPAEYVMKLAEEDPAALAASIVFYADKEAMNQFMSAHGGQENFKSPDPANAKNLPHVRIAKLSASDIVDEPAANPGGFFSDGEEAAARAERVLSWLFGVGEIEAPPAEDLGGAPPERVLQFVNGFLARHGLEVVSVPIEEELNMTEAELKAAQAEAAKQEKDKTLALLKALKEAFAGDEAFAVAAFERGLDVMAAKAEYAAKLVEQGKLKDAEIAKLNEVLTGLRAENEGIRKQLLSGAAPAPHGTEPQAKSFAQMVEAYRAEHKCSYEQAVRICALEHPESYAAAEAGE